MAEHINRVLEVYRNWERELEKLKAINGLKSTDKELLMAQFDFLSKGMDRVRLNPSLGEDLAMKLMAGVLKGLERQIYPNRFLRSMNRLKVALIERPKYVEGFRKFKQENLQRVDAMLKAKGLDQYFGKLDQYLDFERSQVSVDLTANLNGNVDVDYRVHLAKDERGAYEMTGLEVQTTYMDEPEKNRYFNFSSEFDVSADKAVNLLMGRSVLNGHGDANQWLQLLNTEGADYNGIRVYQAGQGFDLEGELGKLAAEIGTYRITATDFVDALKEGHQVRLAGRHPADETVLIEASPATAGVLIRDLNQNIIGVDQVFLGTKQAQAKSQSNQKDISKDKNKDKGDQQDQSLGLGS